MLNIVSMGDYITFTRSYYEDSSDSDDYHTSISSSFDYFDWKSDISDECSLSNENDVEGTKKAKEMKVYQFMIIKEKAIQVKHLRMWNTTETAPTI